MIALRRSARKGVSVAAVGMLVAAQLACSPRETADARTTTTAPDTAGILVTSAAVRAPLELPAQLYVEHDATVVARSSGMIDSVYAELGTRVATGAELVRLESQDQELALAQAEATYENVGRLVARARVMTKAGGTTVADSEQVEFQYRQAEIARRKARRDLDLTRVVAPFAGVITARYARPGRFVAAGDTLFRVTESGPLLARVRVPEGSASAGRSGDRATVATIGSATTGASAL